MMLKRTLSPTILVKSQLAPVKTICIKSYLTPSNLHPILRIKLLLVDSIENAVLQLIN
jgi:hypothetical protein